MTRVFGALLGAAILSIAISALATPAVALGGCGKNAHRDAYGNCVFGGQNQDYCLRTKGRPATRMPNGTWRCI